MRDHATEFLTITYYLGINAQNHSVNIYFLRGTGKAHLSLAQIKKPVFENALIGVLLTTGFF